jgi:hypothetical protein
MKKLAAFIVGAFLLVNHAALADPTPGDQKWLKAVEEMVEKGQTRISTPSQDRVNLLNEWAAKHGLSVVVTKGESGFSIVVERRQAKN